MKRLKNKSVICIWALSYLSMLILSLVAGTYMYQSYEKNLKKEASNIALTNAKNLLRKYDDLVSNIYKDSVHLSFSDNVQMLVDSNGTVTENTKNIMIETTKEIKELGIANNINSTYLYFPTLDYIVDSQSIMESQEFYFSYNGFKMEGYEEWKKKLLTENDYFCELVETSFETGSSVKKKYLSIKQKIPMFSEEEYAVCVTLTPIELFNNMMKDENEQKGVQYILLDNKGNELVSTCDNKLDIPDFDDEEESVERKVNGEKALISVVKSNVAKWKYIVVVPRSSYTEKLADFKMTVILLFTAYILIGLFVVILLLYFNYKPLRKIIRSISEEKTDDLLHSTSEYQLIEKAINNSKSINEEISKNNKKYQHKEFLKKLLRGHVGNAEFEQIKNDHEFKVLSNKFVVLVFHITDINNIFREQSENDNHLEDYTNAKYIIGNIFTELIGSCNNVWQCDIDDRCCILVNVENETLIYEQIAEYTEYAKNIIDEQFNFDFIVAISNINEGKDGIAKCYKEVLEILECQWACENESIIFYDEINQNTELNYYFSLDLERRFINYIQSGDEKSALELFDKIYEENFVNTKLSFEIRKCLMFDLLGSVLKSINSIYPAAEEVYSFDSVNELLMLRNINKMREAIIRILKNCCEYVNNNKNTNIVGSICDFVEKNYSNPNLNISLIASSINRNPSYIATTFKKLTNTKLLDYINKFRIEKAKNLLQEKNLSIQDISVSVGYLNVRTFTNVFRKIEGVTPAQYRKLLG